jgi:hypothetical protein
LKDKQVRNGPVLRDQVIIFSKIMKARVLRAFRTFFLLAAAAFKPRKNAP